MLYGIYNQLDAFILGNIVKILNPVNILDCAPGLGRTTSVILENLNRYEKINYYLFEKDLVKLGKIKEYCSTFSNITFHFDSNIIESKIVPDIGNLDLLFIDCFHDYIIAKWIVRHLFGKVRKNGLIHVHDISYNKAGNGWGDAFYKDVTHPDLVDIGTIKSYYGSLYDEYKEGEPVTIFEPDIIKRFCDLNKDNIQIISVSDICYRFGIKQNIGIDDGLVPPPCSFYIKVENTLNTEV